MSISNIKQVFKTAKFVGSTYFLMLGVINFSATSFYSKITPVDFIILSFGFLPILINKKLFYLVFGLLASVICLYMGFACFTFNLNPNIHTSQTSYNMGYLFIITCFLFSLLLVYSGLNWTEKKQIKLI